MVNKSIIALVAAVVLLSNFCYASTYTQSAGVGISVGSQVFEPRIFMDPDSRILLHSAAYSSKLLIERSNNYAFEGEQIQWDVVVWDKNGIEKVQDVGVGVACYTGACKTIQANCFSTDRTTDPGEIGAWDEENPWLDFDPATMRWFTCKLTVEAGRGFGGTPTYGMYGRYYVAPKVIDLDYGMAIVDEQEYWFFNPEIEVKISGDAQFGEVKSGARAYTTIAISNGASSGSGLMLNMKISGTDFYSEADEGSMCPDSNVLRLNSGGEFREQAECDGNKESNSHDNFCYFAVNGAYSTNLDLERSDSEGYAGIPYETGSPGHRAPLISGPAAPFDYYEGNLLAPGADMAVTLRLDLPEPCNGNFNLGQIYFWGEAV